LDKSGVCISQQSPPACDPIDPTACAQQPLTGCVAVASDPTTGVCLPGCYVADANACQSKPAQCHKRTDPQWKHGTCVGQQSACDPLAPGVCNAQQTCALVAGSAISGAARVCVDVVGSSGVGKPCNSTGGCAAGLWCYAGECTALCTPGGQPCSAGQCEDIGSQLYLNANTLGICQP